MDRRARSHRSEWFTALYRQVCRQQRSWSFTSRSAASACSRPSPPQRRTELSIPRATVWIAPGNIYLGVPDHHLIVRDGEMRLGCDSREYVACPSIDPLFRSAAAAYCSRVVGVLLSGPLNDGAAGLEAIKRCGGVAMVQDPVEALADEMPLSGIAAVTVDLAAPSAHLGDILSEPVQELAGLRLPVRPEIRLETTSPPASGLTPMSCAGSPIPRR